MINIASDYLDEDTQVANVIQKKNIQIKTKAPLKLAQEPRSHTTINKDFGTR